MSNNDLTQPFAATALLVEFDESTTGLLKSLSLFSREEFNQTPFEGSWTAAQVAEHLYKSESGIPFVLKGRKVPANRPIDEKMQPIRSLFLDFEKKFNAPEFILPGNEPKEKDFFLQAFEKSRNEIKRTIDTADMSQLMMEAALPGMKNLTGWEWICFLTCHTKRHIRQLNNIFAIVKNK